MVRTRESDAAIERARMRRYSSGPIRPSGGGGNPIGRFFGWFFEHWWLWLLLVGGAELYLDKKRKNESAEVARIAAEEQQRTSAERGDAWRGGEKRAWVGRHAAMQQRFESHLEGYNYGDASYTRARHALQALDAAIDRDQWDDVEELAATAETALESFEAGCRWVPGMAHSRYSHVRAAAQEGYWNADDGWTFVRDGSLETARVPKSAPPPPSPPKAAPAKPSAPAPSAPPSGPSLEERRAMQAWGTGDKRRYVERSAALSERIEERRVGGYSYGSSALSKARSALQLLDRAIDRDEWAKVPGLCADAEEAVRLFEAGCRWTAGLRHSRFPHIRSAEREGYWNADDGWTFVQDGSLEVVRVCSRCKGEGVELVWVTCPQCNGRGRVETTLGGVTTFLGDLADGIQAVDNIGRALHGKPARGGGGGRRNAETVTCNACNGRGRIQQQQRCSRCNGTGTTR